MNHEAKIKFIEEEIQSLEKSIEINDLLCYVHLVSDERARLVRIKVKLTELKEQKDENSKTIQP